MSEEAGSCVGQKLEAVVTFYRERRPTGATWWRVWRVWSLLKGQLVATLATWWRVFYYSKFYMFYRVGPGWDEEPEPEDYL